VHLPHPREPLDWVDNVEGQPAIALLLLSGGFLGLGLVDVTRDFLPVERNFTDRLPGLKLALGAHDLARRVLVVDPHSRVVGRSISLGNPACARLINVRELGRVAVWEMLARGAWAALVKQRMHGAC